MTNDRPFRIASLLQQEIAMDLARHLDTSKFGLVTVTSVDVNPKLTSATVFVHAQKKNGELAKAVEKSEHYWLKDLQKRITLRKIPHLNFRVDQGVGYANRINDLLREIKEK